MSLLKHIFFGKNSGKHAAVAIVVASSPVILDEFSSFIIDRHIVTDAVAVGAYAYFDLEGMGGEELKSFQETLDLSSLTADILDHFAASVICAQTNEVKYCTAAEDHSIFSGPSIRERLHLAR